MFEDWSRSLSELDTDGADTQTLRRWLAETTMLRAAIDAFDARVARRLGDASAVRGASRCTQREADRAVARGELIEAVPEIGDALATGAISGTHVDTLARVAEQTSVAQLAASDLLPLAKAKPADAMTKQVNDFVRASTTDADLVRRRERQQRDRNASLRAGHMGVVHAEFDDTTFGQVLAAVNAEADRLFHLDGGRDGADEVRTPTQRRADALANLITSSGGAGKRSGSGGPPAVRNQMLIVAYTDGTGEIPGVGPLPRSEVARLACESDLYGLVFDGDGQPLWHGLRKRLADDSQWRALIVRDGGCIGCGAHPSRCQAHHVIWRNDLGPTDIENLALLCTHHHQLVHKAGWRVVQDARGRWALEPP